VNKPIMDLVHCLQRPSNTKIHSFGGCARARLLTIVVALYNVAGLTSPTLWAKGVKKWLSHVERGDAVVATPTPGANIGVVFGASAGTKVKQN